MSGKSKGKVLTVLAVVLLLGFGVFPVLIKFAVWDIPSPDISDFIVDRPEVAPEDNAYTYFLQATNVLHFPEQPDLMTDYLAGKPVDEAAIQQALDSNAECLSLIQKGTTCSICQMPPVEDFQTVCPYISPWLKIATVSTALSQYSRLNRDYRTATDSCILEMKFGNLVLQDAPSLIVFLVGVAVVDQAIAQVLELAKDSGTPIEELGRLSVALQKSDFFGRGLSQAIKGEYVYSTSMIDYLLENSGDLTSFFGSEGLPSPVNSILKRFRRSSYFFQPNKSKQLFADFYQTMVEDSPLLYSEMSIPEMTKDSGGFWTLLRPNGIAHILQALLEPAVEKVMVKKCYMESRVAGAQLVVACNRFEREEGRWPESLQELVPEFLDAVPMDPFDGEPFRYSAEKGLVYSVGKNLTDEGGSLRIVGSDDEYATGRNRRKAEDYVYDLQSAAEPVE